MATTPRTGPSGKAPVIMRGAHAALFKCRTPEVLLEGPV